MGSSSSEKHGMKRFLFNIITKNLCEKIMDENLIFFNSGNNFHRAGILCTWQLARYSAKTENFLQFWTPKNTGAAGRPSSNELVMGNFRRFFFAKF